MRRAGKTVCFVGLVVFSGLVAGACGSGEAPSDEQGDSIQAASQALEEAPAESSVTREDSALEKTGADAKAPIQSALQQDAKLLPMDGVAGDRFGTVVAISGDRVIVGADYDDDKGTDSGAAYIFRNVAGVWVQEIKLVPDDGVAGAHFGSAVAIDMNTFTAVVGAYLDDPGGIVDAGSAYVYQFNPAVNNWVPQAKLVASDASQADRLGLSVAISGHTVITGAYWDDVNASQSGSAYVFVRGGMPLTWTQEQKLSAADGQASDDFGIRVAIDGDWAVVAAHVDDDNGADSGSVYAFARNAGTWVPQGKIKPADGQAGDQFGVSLSMRGLTFLAGAYGDDDLGADAGAAYIFSFVQGAWVQDAKLHALDAAAADAFGFSVSMGTNKAVVGSYNDDTPIGANAGSVYVFRRGMGTWDQEAIVQSNDGQANDVLGYGVSIVPSDDTFVAGAWGDDDLGSNAGSAYVFSFGRKQGEPCMADVECASTYCVDGVCCDEACGGGTDSDCRVCSVAKGSHANGHCATAGFTTICRPAVSACDIAEKCDGMSPTCPTLDKWAAPGTLCRAVNGACDVAETCTGMSNQCPPDAVAPITKLCRAPAGVCDVGETCDGMAKACPVNKLAPAGTVCRPPMGPCDATEVCTGVTASCPGNQYVAANTVCRNAAGPCDAPEKCDGFTAACPADVMKPLNTICRNAAGTCDIVERCNGTTAQCPADTYVAANTVCRSLAGTCDVIEKCTGTSPVCPPNVVATAGVVCRAPAGTCDIAETCNGTSGACPADQYKALNTICRPSMNTTCDPIETCSGTSATCPANSYAPNGTMCGSNMICTNGACVTFAADPTTTLIERGVENLPEVTATDDIEKASSPDNSALTNPSDAQSSSTCTISGAVAQSHTKSSASYAALLALAGAAAIRRCRRSA